MSAITIPLPPFEGESVIEVEVKINGARRRFHYRVEYLRWADCPDPSAAQVQCLKHMIETYDSGWQLVEIGSPTEKFIPLTFKQREVH